MATRRPHEVSMREAVSWSVMLAVLATDAFALLGQRAPFFVVKGALEAWSTSAAS